MNVKKFLKDNHLQQKDLAEYLEVTPAAISRVVNGHSKFSEENMVKLINNCEHWDLTALGESEEQVDIRYKTDSFDLTPKGNTQAEWTQVYEKMIENLEGQCEQLNKRIDQLTAIITNLTSK